MLHAEPLDSNQIRKTSLAILNFAAENIRKRQNIDKLRYDCKHRHGEFNEGDQVKVFTPVRKVGKSEKLLPKLLFSDNNKKQSEKLNNGDKFGDQYHL